jgi:CHRD domain
MYRLQQISMVAALLLAPSLRADTLFTATLSGAQQVPPVSSPGTGFGTVLLNSAQDQITVNLSWSGLTAPAIAAHIHGPAAMGANAPILFPFPSALVPPATSGSIPAIVFPITGPEVGELEAGLLYFNVHTPNHPDGEIRGQITPIPEPSTTAMFACILILVVPVLRRWGAR